MVRHSVNRRHPGSRRDLCGRREAPSSTVIPDLFRDPPSRALTVRESRKSGMTEGFAMVLLNAGMTAPYAAHSAFGTPCAQSSAVRSPCSIRAAAAAATIGLAQ